MISNYDSVGIRPPLFENFNPLQNNFSNSVNPAAIASGEFIGNIYVGPNKEIKLDAENNKVIVGADEEILIDALNKIIQIGDNITLDAENNEITVGSGDEITLDAANKRIEVGGTNVIADGQNKRFLVNDGTNDRCLMGYLAGKF